MHSSRFRWLLLAAAFALLPACGKKAPEQDATASSTPAKSVLTTVQLLKDGKFDALMQHVLPPDAYKQMRTEWQRNHDKMGPVSDADRQQFAQSMQRLTAPDADQKLWAQVQPKLDEFDKKYKTQLPVTVGMAQIMLGTQISKSKDLTADQKKQASDLVAALGDWAQGADWSNPDKVKHAIHVVTSTARNLDIKTLDQAKDLSYDQAMQKYAVVWGGIKQLLDTWGLSIDKTLDSATAKTTASDNHTATVQVDYTLLGKPQQLNVQLIKIDDRWYDKDLLDHWHKHQAEQAAEAASAAPPAAAPATSAAGAH